MSLMKNEILEQAVVTRRCLKENSAQIDSIVSELNSRGIRFVVMAARGTSDHAAVYGKYILESRKGCQVALAAPSVLTLYNKRPDYKDMLVIGISQSGQAQDVREVLQLASEQGAVTVAITNYPDSPLAKTAKYHLNCFAGEEKSVAATKTFTAQMILLASLAAKWSGDRAFFEKLEVIPEKIQETFAHFDEVKSIAKRYRFMEECFVLARGINYAIALEAALKIEETNYIRAKAFAISDFQHGPMAMLQKDMPVLIFAPSGPSERDAYEIIEKARKAQADILVFSDSEKLRALGDCSISTPGGIDEDISPYVNVVLAQMFACSLAEIRGLNPDQPRMLNKITKTY
ncbi:Glutamine-fructose-6-phosphate transaminase (isomerizing) [[Clostridium] cellulosi]|uniref:Glutamine-fructose-6-phosphate transaminase (Isomerizing) n=1 Tax=[Clostridium] cellulosi TaxID=29343 RepID=A0A078KV74_9FIRM|nr:Glutamine-fructose-6-phosphate transaminase (isomerizing) [[Clostridium] cellulosi]